MQRRYWISIFLILLLLLVGITLAQDTSESETEAERERSFEIVAEIGRALPRSLLYDPNFERYLIVDAYGRLLFQDALTFDVQTVLYESGGYNDYAFSHDGRFLALAIEERIELWDTQTGERIARLTELGEPLQVVGAVQFSRDDRLLIFQGVYPAPRSIRVRENQTINVPWIWHIPAALGQEEAPYPGGAEAWQFFDYRNGMVIAPDNRIVAALPSRLQVLDGESLDLIFEIPTDRYETDPMTVWFSARDEQVYVRPVSVNSLIQVDTQQGVLVEIPLNRILTLSDLELIGNIELSQQSRLIGGDTNNALKTIFLPEYFDIGERHFTRQRSIMTLVDLVVPPISQGDNIAALLFIYSEAQQSGFFYLTNGDSQQLILSPDENELIARRYDETDGLEYITAYDLDTGERLRRFVPSLRDIGRYNRVSKNRVLAYDATGDVLVSDFQRVDAESTEVLAEDLRYSRRFDSFYFSEDSQQMVTLAGTEWRLWDVQTGDVLRREILQLRGSLVATSSDGFRFLVRGDSNMTVYDLRGGDVQRETVRFADIDGGYIEQVYYSPDWTSFLVVYGANPYGQYFPGNEVAMYSMEEGMLWHIAGDDLPPPESRQYGFIDSDHAYIIGNGSASSQPERIYGALYDASGVPACIVEAYPEELSTWQQLWERQIYALSPDKLHVLTNLICGILPDTTAEVEALLLPTATPLGLTPTGVVVAGVPACLTNYFIDAPYTYAELWEELSQGLSPEEIAAAETLVCQGISNINNRYYPSGVSDESFNVTMIIDSQGLRASGAYTPVQIIRRPLQPIYEEFERTEDRTMGIAILSPDARLVAASNLPGELVIYRLIVPYETLVVRVTETSQAIQAQQNLVYPLPSNTPNFVEIGTARPTLTPTVTPTLIPLPEEESRPALQVFCPSEQLYSPENLPEGYAPTGSIIAPLLENVLWRLNPVTGERLPDETVPQCGEGIQCDFSPSRDWILAYSSTEMYVIRPNGSDFRLLFDEDDFWLEMSWTGNNILQYPTRVERDGYFQEAVGRDILGVFPDPEPYFEEARINEMDAEFLGRQPGGDWAVARIPFSTGTGLIYQYYLFNMVTGESMMFERYPELALVWHPLGRYLYYAYYEYRQYGRRDREGWFEIDLSTMEKAPAQFSPYLDSTWSNEGRYQAYRTGNRAYPVGVYDTETGQERLYCVPETGARTYDGTFVWSPYSRYLALRAPLPADEADEGVGQHLMILDTETGAMVDLSTGTGEVVSWIQEVYP
jgi:WD40 repeat protein